MAHLVVIRFQLNSSPSDGPGKFWYATGMFAQKHVDPNGYVQNETGNMFTWAAKPDRKNSTIFFVHNIYNDLNRMDSLVELPVQFRQLVSSLVYQGPGTMGDLPAPSDLGWKEWTPGEETKSPSTEEKIPNVEETPEWNEEPEEVAEIIYCHTIPLSFLYRSGFFDKLYENEFPEEELKYCDGMVIVGFVRIKDFDMESGEQIGVSTYYLNRNSEMFRLKEEASCELCSAMIRCAESCTANGLNVRQLWFEVEILPCPFSDSSDVFALLKPVKAEWAK